MKSIKFIFSLFVLLLVVSFVSTAAEKQNPPDGPIKMTDDVKAIIDNSCFQCHNSEATNEHAVMDLNFDELDDLPMVQKLVKLNNISKEVEEKKMPPQRFVENSPDKALSDEDITLLTEWVKGEIESLTSE